MENQPGTRQPKIFLSYAQSDRPKVEQIASALRTAGMSVWLDAWELALGDSITERVERAVQTSDVFLVFLSPASVGSTWVQGEFNHMLTREMTDRAISVVPVLLENCEIPPAFAGRLYIDMRHDWSAGVGEIVRQVARANKIDLLQLDGGTFEQLARDLLLALDFSVTATSLSRDGGFDFIATQTGSDPSNPTNKMAWVVEVKAYRQQRVGVQVVRQLAGVLTSFPQEMKGMLITSGQLTSVARETVSDVSAMMKREIRVIDGAEVRSLLLKFPDLVSQYFPMGKNS